MKIRGLTNQMKLLSNQEYQRILDSFSVGRLLNYGSQVRKTVKIRTSTPTIYVLGFPIRTRERLDVFATQIKTTKGDYTLVTIDPLQQSRACLGINTWLDIVVAALQLLDQQQVLPTGSLNTTGSHRYDLYHYLFTKTKVYEPKTATA